MAEIVTSSQNMDILKIELVSGGDIGYEIVHLRMK